MRRKPGLFLLAILLTACGEATPALPPTESVLIASATSSPSIPPQIALTQTLNTAAPADARPTLTSMPPDATAPPFLSGGLGVTKAEWEQEHGPGTPVGDGSFTYGADYMAGPAFTVYFGQAPYNLSLTDDSLVNAIERNWPPAEYKSLSVARRAALQLVPADAVLIKTDTSVQHPPLDIYQSRSLADRERAFHVADLPWDGGPLGTFHVYYQGASASLFGISIDVGDQP